MTLPPFTGRSLIGLASLLAIAAIAPESLGAPTATERATAREQGYGAMKAYKSGRYDDALAGFERAYALVKAPTLGLWTARCLVKSGKLVEATERYLEVTRLEPEAGGDVQLQKDAQRAAREERLALLPRLPRVRLVVPVPREGLEVTVDGELIVDAMLGAAIPMNPGEHVVVIRRGAATRRRTLSLAEGESQELSLEPPPMSAAPAAGTSGPGEARTPEQSAGPRKSVGPTERPPEGRTLSTLGWVGVGVGGAGILTGVVTMALALGEQSTLAGSSGCRSGECLPDEHDTIDRYDTYRTASTIGFVSGGVLAAAGVTLLLVAPAEARATTASLTITGDGVKLRGSF